MSATDPLAPLEALAEEWIENGVPARDCCGDHDADEALFAMQDAITEARALLGEVSVREEFGIRYFDGDLDGGYAHFADVRADMERSDEDEPMDIVHRTHTTRSTKWEVARPREEFGVIYAGLDEPDSWGIDGRWEAEQAMKEPGDVLVKRVADGEWEVVEP